MEKIPSGIFVVGTDTEVGKTVVTAGIVLALKRRQIPVVSFKPIATGCLEENGNLVSEDACFLAEANEEKNPNHINPIRFKEPLAPYVAAKIQGTPISPQEALLKLDPNVFSVVEGIGGLMVPITKKLFVRDLICDYHLPVIIVGRIGLGTINHTVSTIELLREKQIPIEGFYLNGLKENNATLAEKTNAKIIEDLTQIKHLGTLPWIENVSVSKKTFGNLEDVFVKHISLDFIQSFKVGTHAR